MTETREAELRRLHACINEVWAYIKECANISDYDQKTVRRLVEEELVIKEKHIHEGEFEEKVFKQKLIQLAYDLVYGWEQEARKA